MKNPLYVDAVVLKNGGFIETEAGTDIVTVSAAWVPTINTTTETVVDLTTTGNTVIGNSASDTLTLTATMAGKIPLALNGGAASASGLLMGVGTTANPASTATADAFFAEFRTRSTATTGTSRGLYWRHELAGAGGEGECLRAFTKLSAATTTARGAQISLDVNTTGSLTGLGCAVDAQILVPNQALGAGTYGVVNSEIFSAGSSSSVAASNIAFFRAVASGNATGIATVDTAGLLFNIQWVTMGSGKLFQANTAGAASHALKIKINNVAYYIMLTDTGA